MNYLDKILELDQKGAFAPGEVSRVGVAHDSWCRVWKDGACNCNPDVGVKSGQPNRAARRASQKRGKA